MNKFFYALCIALAILMTIPAHATIRYLSLTGAGSYSTITAAYGAAVAGDTVLVGPGIWNENPPTFDKRLTWIGAGWDQTVWNGIGNAFFVGSNSDGSSFEGIRFQTGSSGYVIQASGTADSLSFRRCIIEKPVGSTAAGPIYFTNVACRLYMEDCVIMGNVNGYSVLNMPNAATLWRNCVFAMVGTSNNPLFDGSATSGTTELYNCVFLNIRTLFNLPTGAQPVIAINNVFYDWGTSPTFGTYPTANSIFDYNASTSALAAPGTNPIALGATDPFVNYDETANYVFGTSDLHLAVGSPLIDAGHPNLTDFTDATRSDCGIYGGPRPLIDGGVPNYPWAVNVIVSPNLIGQGTPVNATAIGRVGPQY